TLAVLASEKVNPTITSPSDQDSITEPIIEVQWTVDDQSAYRVRLLDSNDDPLHDSDWIGSAVDRAYEIPLTLTDGTYTIELTTKNTEGLASDPDSVEVTVSLTLPPEPQFTLTPNPAAGTIDITIDNGTPDMS